MSNGVAHRITIVLSDKNFRKLKSLQGRKIQESLEGVSFSSLINEVIESGLKK